MNQDVLDLLREFSVAEVRYLLVGAHAVGYWATPRATGDVDFFIEPSPENANRVMEALKAFGAPIEGISVSDFETPDLVFQMGFPPRRIDLMTSLSGLSFAEAWEDHATLEIHDLAVPVIGRKPW